MTADQIIPDIMQRSSFGAEKVIVYALKLAGTLEQLTPEHLFLSLCAVDPGLLSKLRGTHIDMKKLVADVRCEIARSAADVGGSVEAISSVLMSASDMAPPGIPIATAHLFVAILLEATNRVSQRLREKGIDVSAFIRNRFPFISAKSKLLKARRYQSPEARARAWLCRLIPDQGSRYLTQGFLEIRSTLHHERLYRIHRENCGTEIYQRGALVATACIHTRDSLPVTDRVLAEFLLLKWDESDYLNTANITRV